MVSTHRSEALFVRSHAGLATRARTPNSTPALAPTGPALVLLVIPGSYYVLPSFFDCLLALKEAEADFGVVFRTFGEDITAVSREYNAFCEGLHPLFPGVRMDGR